MPLVRTVVPGPNSRAQVTRLAAHECPAITVRRARRAGSLGAESDDPIVWDRAIGANVADVDGNVFVDLTAGFGVALVGHRHPAVVAAAQAQSARLIHAMGDAWPDAQRVDLLERLAAVCPGELSVSILGLSGSDAVDAAIKTARLATGRAGVLTFERGYHGLALGVLGLQGYKAAFTEPFADITHPAVTRLPFGCDAARVTDALSRGDIGLVLAEPIQGRGGIHPAPPGWLTQVKRAAHRAGALFALDEIQTGMGRTGAAFAGPAHGVVPDLMCVGKALAGGFPLSACVGTPAVMAAWGRSTGEAIHTQTFLGHPVGCAAALAVIGLLPELLVQVQRDAAALERDLEVPLRGVGLMRAVPVKGDALAVSRALLQRGFLVLPAGPDSLSLTPPIGLTPAQRTGLRDALSEWL